MTFIFTTLFEHLLEKVAEHVVVTTAVAATTYVATETVSRAAGSLGESSFSSSSSSGFYLERKTIFDWWLNGLTGYERQRLIGLGCNDRSGCFTLQEVKDKIYRADKEPGVPTKEDGYEPPNNWDGKLRKVGNSQKKDTLIKMEKFGFLLAKELTM